MPKKLEPIAEYVRRVNKDTRQFAQALLEENKRLRAVGAKIENEKGVLEEELRLTRQELALWEQRGTRLRRQMEEVEAANERFSTRFVDLEQQNFNLLNLYVASYRLHGTLSRREVLTTIQEIVTNLVGSEEMAVFDRSGRPPRLALLAHAGIESDALGEVRKGRGVIAGVAETGEAFLRQNGSIPEGALEIEKNLTACVPLRVEGNVTGAIAIFRLLQQKPGLEEVDQELLNLLATHAAMALYCTELHEKSTARSERVA